MRVEAAVLNFPSLISLKVSVDVMQSNIESIKKKKRKKKEVF